MNLSIGRDMRRASPFNCGAAALAAALAAFCLAGCAGKASKPAPAPEPLQPISRIAVLPVATEAMSAESERRPGFGPGRDQGYVPMTGANGQALRPGDAIVAGVAAGLIIVAADSIGASVRDRAANLERAVLSLSFRPAKALNARLVPAFEQAGLRVDAVGDGAEVGEARGSGEYKSVAGQADAVLDIHIAEYGYYSSSRAGGLSPMLNINASLISTATNEEVASYTYYSDWRERAQDRRWFTSPKNLIFADAMDLAAHGDIASAGLEAIVQKMVDQLVLDVKRRAEGLPAED